MSPRLIPLAEAVLALGSFATGLVIGGLGEKPIGILPLLGLCTLCLLLGVLCAVIAFPRLPKE